MKCTTETFHRITAIVLLSGLATTARAEWTICNRTAEDVDVAVAFVNPRGGFVSKGWYTLGACGGCKTVLQRNETSDPNNVFLRAEGRNNGFLIDGDHQFCASDGRFTITTRQCNDKRGFKQEMINLDKHFTTNITGRSSSNKVCID
jgi:uncharacterized membrane protein